MAEAGVVVSDKLSPDAQQFISKPKRCGSPTESSSSNCSTSSSITSQEIENFGGQRFPHLRLVDLLSTNKDEQGMEFNSVKGIPFQSKLFKGKAIFKLRPKSTSILSGPYVDYFERYQRFFSLQIQGKFLLSSEELKNKMVNQMMCRFLASQSCSYFRTDLDRRWDRSRISGTQTRK